MARSLLIRILPLVTVALTLLAVGTARAQQRWSWPERAENLTELPADFPGQRLRAVMTGFTRALGVRCSHCHVGEDGQPLSTFDFASDENPKKNIARGMLQLLGVVNDKLDTIELVGEERVNTWCHTCHHGLPLPSRLSEVLTGIYQTDGIEPAISRLHELRERYYGAGAYDFSERSLDRLGRDLLSGGDHDAAIALLQANAGFYPRSAGVWDSLAEAYMTAGQEELAIVYYQKTLGIDSNNPAAVAKLHQLRGGGS